ncbi:MAG: hypothetical protein M0R03_22045 [Novosphingobium sp.]|jgi:hypothetical protein|nr:hypothetical protein [Novosphingobium sp.]
MVDKILKEYKKLLERKITEKDPEFYNIINYKWNKDGTLDVDGHVFIESMNLTKIPFKFGVVTGFFSCMDNELTSLEGCPREVGECAYFSLNYKLKSLKYFPRKIGDNVWIRNCGKDFDEEYIRARCDVGGSVFVGEM